MWGEDTSWTVMKGLRKSPFLPPFEQKVSSLSQEAVIFYEPPSLRNLLPLSKWLTYHSRKDLAFGVEPYLMELRGYSLALCLAVIRGVAWCGGPYIVLEIQLALVFCQGNILTSILCLQSQDLVFILDKNRSHWKRNRICSGYYQRLLRLLSGIAKMTAARLGDT